MQRNPFSKHLLDAHPTAYHCRLCIKCALKLKHGAIEKISYISSEDFIFKASKRNDYDSGKTLADQ